LSFLYNHCVRIGRPGNTDANADSDGNRDIDADADSYSYANFNSESHSNAQGHTDPETSPIATPAPESVAAIW
jgi:hypothetical protein